MMIKNKKTILILAFVLFLPMLVFGANGELCKQNKGTCRTEDAFQTCLGSEKNSGQSDCANGQVCCTTGSTSGDALTKCIETKCNALTNDQLKKSCEADCQKEVEQGNGGTGTGGGTSASGSTTITFPNPLQFNTIEEVLTSLLSNLQAIIATIALIFIVLGGLYIISAGTSKRVEDGKKMITYALIGLAIVLAAPTFLREIKIILGAGDTGTGLRAIEIAKNVLVFLLSILGIFAIIMMVIGGLMYLTSYGDEKKMQEGKRTATYAVIGIAVALSGVILIQQVVELLQ